MYKKYIPLLVVCLAVSGTFFGCGGGDTSTTPNSTTTPSSTATPTASATPTPTATPTCAGNGNGMPLSDGVYVQNGTVGSTISSVTLYFGVTSGNGATTGTYNLTLTAHQCGFTGGSPATASQTVDVINFGTYYAVTFSFGTPYPIIACSNNSGAGTVGFVIANLSGGTNFFVESQYTAGSSCRLTTASDDTSSPPTINGGGWSPTGNFVSP